MQRAPGHRALFQMMIAISGDGTFPVTYAGRAVPTLAQAEHWMAGGPLPWQGEQLGGSLPIASSGITTTATPQGAMHRGIIQGAASAAPLQNAASAGARGPPVITPATSQWHTFTDTVRQVEAADTVRTLQEHAQAKMSGTRPDYAFAETWKKTKLGDEAGRRAIAGSEVSIRPVAGLVPQPPTTLTDAVSALSIQEPASSSAPAQIVNVAGVDLMVRLDEHGQPHVTKVEPKPEPKPETVELAGSKYYVIRKGDGRMEIVPVEAEVVEPTPSTDMSSSSISPSPISRVPPEEDTANWQMAPTSRAHGRSFRSQDAQLSEHPRNGTGVFPTEGHGRTQGSYNPSGFRYNPSAAPFGMGYGDPDRWSNQDDRVAPSSARPAHGVNRYAPLSPLENTQGSLTDEEGSSSHQGAQIPWSPPPSVVQQPALTSPPSSAIVAAPVSTPPPVATPVSVPPPVAAPVSAPSTSDQWTLARPFRTKVYTRKGLPFALEDEQPDSPSTAVSRTPAVQSGPRPQPPVARLRPASTFAQAVSQPTTLTEVNARLGSSLLTGTERQDLYALQYRLQYQENAHAKMQKQIKEQGGSFPDLNPGGAVKPPQGFGEAPAESKLALPAKKEGPIYVYKPASDEKLRYPLPGTLVPTESCILRHGAPFNPIIPGCQCQVRIPAPKNQRPDLEYRCGGPHPDIMHHGVKNHEYDQFMAPSVRSGVYKGCTKHKEAAEHSEQDHGNSEPYEHPGNSVWPEEYRESQGRAYPSEAPSQPFPKHLLWPNIINANGSLTRRAPLVLDPTPSLPSDWRNNGIPWGMRHRGLTMDEAVKAQFAKFQRAINPSSTQNPNYGRAASQQTRGWQSQGQRYQGVSRHSNQSHYQGGGRTSNQGHHEPSLAERGIPDPQHQMGVSVNLPHSHYRKALNPYLSEDDKATAKVMTESWYAFRDLRDKARAQGQQGQEHNFKSKMIAASTAVRNAYSHAERTWTGLATRPQLFETAEERAAITASERNQVAPPEAPSVAQPSVASSKPPADSLGENESSSDESVEDFSPSVESGDPKAWKEFRYHNRTEMLRLSEFHKKTPQQGLFTGVHAPTHWSWVTNGASAHDITAINYVPSSDEQRWSILEAAHKDLLILYERALGSFEKWLKINQRKHVLAHYGKYWALKANQSEDKLAAKKKQTAFETCLDLWIENILKAVREIPAQLLEISTRILNSSGIVESRNFAYFQTQVRMRMDAFVEAVVDAWAKFSSHKEVEPVIKAAASFDEEDIEDDPSAGMQGGWLPGRYPRQSTIDRIVLPESYYAKYREDPAIVLRQEHAYKLRTMTVQAPKEAEGSFVSGTKSKKSKNDKDKKPNEDEDKKPRPGQT